MTAESAKKAATQSVRMQRNDPLAGDFGVDVMHLNLHKTFCIPHGGGGPARLPASAGSVSGSCCEH